MTDRSAAERAPGPAPIEPMASFAPDLFRGRVAVVTGGGTGIGRRTAVGFASYGAHVVVAGRTESSLQETVEEIAALDNGARGLAVPTNIRAVDEVERLRARVLEQHGRVDFLVNNAGGQFPAAPGTISDNGWRSVVDLNLNGTWNMVNRFTGPMIEAKYGAIVNVVHIFSFDRGAPMFVHSGAARAGVVSLTRTMAPYLAHHGVTINAIAPGTIATAGMQEKEMGELGYTEASWAERFEQLGPMRRMGTAEETAATILFLCSPAARYISGAAIVADGAESQANWLLPFEPGTT